MDHGRSDGRKVDQFRAHARSVIDWLTQPAWKNAIKSGSAHAKGGDTDIAMARVIKTFLSCPIKTAVFEGLFLPSGRIIRAKLCNLIVPRILICPIV